jgi:hypothetical protein
MDEFSTKNGVQIFQSSHIVIVIQFVYKKIKSHQRKELAKKKLSKFEQLF